GRRPGLLRNYRLKSAPRKFSDASADWRAAPWIEALAAEGITDGGKFCPKTTVNREQMAVFLVAAFNLP
ncbi:MAG: S-layer homology domain-containing protein, partial [Chloroflexota bacterium]